MILSNSIAKKCIGEKKRRKISFGSWVGLFFILLSFALMVLFFGLCGVLALYVYTEYRRICATVSRFVQSRELRL